MSLDLRTIARALGGEVQGRQVLAPGPNHGRSDRSLSVRISHQSPTGYDRVPWSGVAPRVAETPVRAPSTAL